MITRSLYILIAIGVVVLICLVFILLRKLRHRVWISASPNPSKKRPPVKIAYLHYDKTEVKAAIVTKIGNKKAPALGQVALNSEGDEAMVFLLSSLTNEDVGEIQYKECGYVDMEGYIYKKGDRNPIGYMAQPRNPQIPTTKGQRNWYQLWRKSYLNVYLGVLKQDNDNETLDEKKTGSKRKHAKYPEPVLVGSVVKVGLHQKDKGYVSSEARACGFAFFYSVYPRTNFQEQIDSRAYGWKDTAFIASLVYTVLFGVAFLYHFFIDHLSLLRFSFFSPIKTACNTVSLTALFFIIWIIVRSIKIQFAENDNPLQSRIDMFNKILSLKKIDALILILAVPAAVCSCFYYRTNFIPLIIAIVLGVSINKGAYGSRTHWFVRSKFNDDEESEEEELVIKQDDNPSCDDENAIAVDYVWQLGCETGTKLEGHLQLYFPIGYIEDLRRCNPFYSQRTDGANKKLTTEMFHILDSHPLFMQRVKYVARYINKMALLHNLTAIEELQFALDFVQEPNITFKQDSLSTPINNLNRYIRFPDETMYDKEGDCDCKSFLAAMLFYAMGYDVLYLVSREYQHAAIGVLVPDNLSDLYDNESVLLEKCIEYENRQYIICETTGDEFQVGQFYKPMSVSDFDEKILFEQPAPTDDEKNSDESKLTRIYNWDLDSAQGKELKGNLILGFDEKEIKILRADNPFDYYGENGATYEDNVRLMVDYLTDESFPARLCKLNTIANYIKDECTKTGLNSYDTIQFVLDFVQEPNIKYCVDENSAGINYAKEYMRFPDETLYDKEGDCDCKSFLAAMLFKVMGYRVIFMISNTLKHAAIGVECDELLKSYIPEEKKAISIREYNGVEYAFCETTSDGHKVGISSEMNINDFESIVEIKK